MLILYQFCRSTVIGVASFAHESCEALGIAVYARVTDVLDWIKMYTRGTAEDSSCRKV